ncbi:MAG: HAD-IIIC family phosphatase [Candidatus Xenobiia bacterium LiM19]
MFRKHVVKVKLIVEILNNGEKKKIKCLVWDLDNTLWDGVLLESDQISLRENALQVIRTLDERGILHSIASRNSYEPAMKKIKEFGLSEYFLYPQINWNPKSSSLSNIAKELNIGTNTLAFVDDQPFEREEVKFTLPEVLCIDGNGLDRIADMPEMQPRFVTDDSKNRRFMYLSDIRRNTDENSFEGPKDEFLSTLGMVFTIRAAGKDDLQRAEELTVRTNQLNTTGYTYSHEELDHLRTSPQHRLLIAELEDKYGSYGRIGLALVETGETQWIIKLLLMSCRVMSRGVGSMMIRHIIDEAMKKKVLLRAEMIPNDRNRMMYMTYKFSGFRECGKNGSLVIFEHDRKNTPGCPDYVKLIIDDHPEVDLLPR